MKLAKEFVQSRKENQRDQYQDEAQTQHYVVNEKGKKTEPKSGVLDARYGGVFGIRGNGRPATAHRRRNRCTHHRGARRRSSNGKRLAAIRAIQRASRHRAAALGTIHGASSTFSWPLRESGKIVSQILLSSEGKGQSSTGQWESGKIFIALVRIHRFLTIHTIQRILLI